jgi:hypothetical protein
MIGQHFSIMRKSIWCFVQTWFPWLGFVLTASVFFAAASFSWRGQGHHSADRRPR